MTTDQPTASLDLEQMYEVSHQIRQLHPGTIWEQTTRASGRDQIADRIGVTFKFTHEALSYGFEGGRLMIVPTNFTDEHAITAWQEFTYSNPDHVSGVVEMWLSHSKGRQKDNGNVVFVAETKKHNGYMSLEFRPHP